LSNADRSDVPALIINTWGDQTVGDTLALAERWRLAGTQQKVVIAPGTHCHHEDAGDPTGRFGELDVANADWPWESAYLQWFDHWLRGRGDGLAEQAAYTYFMLGENRWRTAASWPPAEAELRRWYLDSAGNANSRRGDGRLVEQPPSMRAIDQFRYDPADPVPTRGGPICCTGNAADQAGPVDQADVETRDDVLVYTSPPLAQDLLIAGPIRARLIVSSSAADTDFLVRLVHVWPDGRATGIQEGALRLRYRDGFVSPKLLAPGERTQITIDIRSIAYEIPRGHRMRVHVTSSSFPRLERNLNTGAPNNADETLMVVAVNSVFHGPEDQSTIETYVLPSIDD
jgi:putative CocE/NonD family hydrolase